MPFDAPDAFHQRQAALTAQAQDALLAGRLRIRAPRPIFSTLAAIAGGGGRVIP